MCCHLQAPRRHAVVAGVEGSSRFCVLMNPTCRAGCPIWTFGRRIVKKISLPAGKSFRDRARAKNRFAAAYEPARAEIRYLAPRLVHKHDREIHRNSRTAKEFRCSYVNPLTKPSLTQIERSTSHDSHHNQGIGPVGGCLSVSNQTHQYGKYSSSLICSPAPSPSVPPWKLTFWCPTLRLFCFVAKVGARQSVSTLFLPSLQTAASVCS
jgi:hypothetical protein